MGAALRLVAPLPSESEQQELFGGIPDQIAEWRRTPPGRAAMREVKRAIRNWCARHGCDYLPAPDGRRVHGRVVLAVAVALWDRCRHTGRLSGFAIKVLAYEAWVDPRTFIAAVAILQQGFGLLRVSWPNRKQAQTYEFAPAGEPWPMFERRCAVALAEPAPPAAQPSLLPAPAPATACQHRPAWDAVRWWYCADCDHLMAPVVVREWLVSKNGRPVSDAEWCRWIEAKRAGSIAS